MKRHWIDHLADRFHSPLTAWVHAPVDPELDFWDALRSDAAFDPPLPRDPEGYPRFSVEIDGFTFVFASLHELRHCVEILAQKVLPQTVRDGGWSNRHWLSRLPAETKAWRYREVAVRYLERAGAEFETR